MSSRVKAFILQDMNDVECIEEALDAMGESYTKNQNQIVISPNLKIDISSHQAELEVTYDRADSNHINTNQFIADLTKEYNKIIKEKIERLKLEEAKVRESEVLEQFSEDEKRKKELKLKKERLRLEAIKRKEKAELRKKISEKANAIRDKAKKLGYQIKEEVKGEERVMVLIRR